MGVPSSHECSGRYRTFCLAVSAASPLIEYVEQPKDSHAVHEDLLHQFS